MCRGQPARIRNRRRRTGDRNARPRFDGGLGSRLEQRQPLVRSAGGNFAFCRLANRRRDQPRGQQYRDTPGAEKNGSPEIEPGKELAEPGQSEADAVDRA